MTQNIAIFISGRGSNMAALIEAAQDSELDARVALVVSNKPDAAGLEKATAAGIETLVVPSKGKSREAFEQEVERHLIREQIDLICLAGFMRVLSAGFVGRWESKILNIHPSLLPSFPGLHVHEQALSAGVAVSGCSVHWVTAELDSGPIVGQAVVPVSAIESADDLAERIQQAEHPLYAACLRRVLGGKPKTETTDQYLLCVL
ncbi:MAG: phosphoribosylglycinamide formyltransferase [Parvularculaceae bacterium]|nr:phosphoribosylglycinamide formyltransferase [Parvularculaceae bacterium]